MGYFYTQLTQIERDQISILDAGGLSCADIGKCLHHDGMKVVCGH